MACPLLADLPLEPDEDEPAAGMVWVAVAPWPAASDEACSCCQALGDDVTYTDLSTEPCCSTLAEMWLSFPKVPRGTPSPAESLRKTNESFSLSLEATRGFSLTATMVAPKGTGLPGGGLRRHRPVGSRAVGLLRRPFH